MAGASGDGLHCVVAGGSLVGLSAAIALSRLGMDVTVLERSPARAVAGGGGLGVDVALLQQVTGLPGEPPVLHGIDRDTTAWHLLQGWLEDQAGRRAGVAVHRGTEVSAVRLGDDQQRASVMTAGGGEYPADLVVGADGARSTVRAAVDPDFPDARYAGVLLWRSLVDERALPAGVALPGAGEPSREVYAGPYRLVTYLVPGALPGPIRERLAGFATANWPSPWREALTLALYNGTVFGTPIVHYEPKQLARGRAVLAGDAAHAASPMVGGGFRQGLYDVAALAQAMTGPASPRATPGALRRYQELRLGPAAQHVAVSERATADYLAHAAEGSLS
jgi:2-polyprenyl-6-methoxyphenol hydroxylase-like FAD-dependent oxidoreductase